MKTIFSIHEHSTLGFPKIILKFNFNGKKCCYESPYLIVKGVIKPWKFEITPENCSVGDIQRELNRFDNWVRSVYSNDPTVQG